MAEYDRKEDFNHIRWSAAVKRRDHFTCQICERRGEKLNAHHIYAYNRYKDLRYDLDNGITLCETCHKDFHQIYENGDNTAEQFEEYKKTRLMLIEHIRREKKKNKIVEKIISDLQKEG